MPLTRYLLPGLTGLLALAACQHPVPLVQLTAVQGVVVSADTGQPLPGVLLAIESFTRGYYGATNFRATGDSVRTDAQGTYALHFYSQPGFYYAVSFEPSLPTQTQGSSRFAFLTNPDNTGGTNRPSSQELRLGQGNTVNFGPNELRTVAVRIRNRRTGWQRLEFGADNLHGDNLDTTAYLRNFALLPTATRFRYRQYTANRQFIRDTLVALVLQNPTAPPLDTLRATLTFVR